MTIMGKTIIEINADCEITYSNGDTIACPFRPHFVFAECDPGYGDNGYCEKWKYYHKKE